MKILLGVINSDSVNKKNMKFPIGGLEEALSDKWLEGVPVNIGHDLHKPLGWGRPFGLYLEPGLSRLMGLTYIPENKEEQQIITNVREKIITDYHIKMCNPHIDEFLKIISSISDGTTKFLYTSCVTAIEKDIAPKLFPDIFANTDKDGLIDIKFILDEFDVLGHGYFKHKKSNLVLMVHRYFRKSLSLFNNYNQEFLERFFNLTKSEGLNLKIALDKDSLGLSDTYKTSIELEYWRGPKYDDEIETMKPGVTVHSTRQGDFEKHFHNIDKTEFWFKKDSDMRIFEIEELKDFPSFENGKEVYANRYIHTIYNITNKKFEHFDGAIKIYDENEYLERSEVDIKKAGKRAFYAKLFRIDDKTSGNLSVTEWKSLVTDYYRGNPLIGEYFLGENEEDNHISKILHTEGGSNVIYEKCPYLIEKNMGIRMLISYFPINAIDINVERKIQLHDTITRGAETFDVIEHDVIELKKALLKLGTDLEIPKDVKLIACEDLYLNLPLIKHGKKNFPNNIKLTIKAISMIIEKLVIRKSNHVYSINISWLTDTKEVRLSLFGHISDLNKWINEFSDKIPLKESEINDWIVKINEWLNSNFKASNDIPALGNIVNETGIIWISRKPLEIDEEIQLYPDKKQIKYDLKIPKNKVDLIDVVDKKIIEPALAYFLKKSTCRKCRKNYLTCAHSKYLDDNVVHEISKSELVMAFWSDKKA
jgi:hypothetical protein